MFQTKGMDIVNAMPDVESIKHGLRKLRSKHVWNSLLEKVCLFCWTYEILVMDMKND
jgi:hypothetical protein